MTTLHLGREHIGIRSKAKLDDIVEKSLRDAAIWEETKDRLKKERSWYVWWTAAEIVYCACAGGTTGSAFDGRAYVGS